MVGKISLMFIIKPLLDIKTATICQMSNGIAGRKLGSSIPCHTVKPPGFCSPENTSKKRGVEQGWRMSWGHGSKLRGGEDRREGEPCVQEADGEPCLICLLQMKCSPLFYFSHIQISFKCVGWNLLSGGRSFLPYVLTFKWLREESKNKKDEIFFFLILGII